MAPKYKLIYFNAAGRAEHIRYILAFAGQDFEDSRISKEEWLSLKPKTPFGKIPVLEIDGKLVSQSNAIARYLAKQFGLLGHDEATALRADELVEALVDMRMVAVKKFREENPEAVVYLQKEENYFLDKFEKIVIESSSGFLAGSQITWADLTFASTLSSDPNSEKTLKSYPGLSAYVAKINSLPGIKEYLALRPKSDLPPKGSSRH
ncbi:glutathione S-transferase-like [Euwallacea fornicatus]|uniref:glutathione S-transferase-like n=1 Tax=Euwallacea fornicatus TaxID=995702 RepID=UPI00338DCCE2